MTCCILRGALASARPRARRGAAVAAMALAGLAGTGAAQDAAAGGPAWNDPARPAKVAAIIPGRRTPTLTPETLFADWTREQVARWNQSHPALPPAEAYASYAAAAPTDADLTTDFPVHISPFGRPHGVAGNAPAGPLADKANAVLLSWCPVCGSFSMGLAFDPQDPYGHATTTCCRTDLYARTADWPPDSPLKPTTTARFLHLDDTWVEVPCTVFTDRDGVAWELFFSTLFAHKRWLEQGCTLVKGSMDRFKETADPVHAHKIAVILDRVADTYYGLPLAAHHRLCNGRDGQPLTRAEWEAVPRPAIFEVSYLGAWSRRQPYSSPGWLNMLREHIWVEPFARVRHHPAFKEVSRQLHGDPEALDRKIRTRLLRELSMMFQSVFSQKLLHNYQEAIYIDLWLLGVLTEDPVLIDFAGPCQELSMYNHTYQDGMNGEGAPNYQAMPGGYYYPVLKDPKGWLQYQPCFLEDNPFVWAASAEMTRSETVRGLSLEWGDQHQYAYASNFLSDPAKVRENERRGSRNWPGYGVGVLRVGGHGHRQEISLNYTRVTLHNAQDALSLECWFDGVPVMRRGGYAAWWHSARLQWDRPEFQALRGMDYPHPIEAADGSGFNSWSWSWAHSALNQNTLTVDDTGTGRGWGDNRGYGECVTFKGGEAAGTPGSGFQVLDVRDHYSWSRVGKDVRDWRRTIVGVEGPDGRPYALDITHLVGGQRHALYNQAWATRAEAQLPPATGQAADLAQAILDAEPPTDAALARDLARVRAIERTRPTGDLYGVTWRQDYGAWGPRDPDGKPYQRPLPEDVGKVRLRFIALNQGDGRTELLSGKGPWIGWLRQPLPDGQRVNGNVAFTDARDILVESRTGGTPEAPLQSAFVHVLEGFRDDESSAIAGVERLEATSLAGPARQITALRLRFTAGHTDTLIVQSEPGTVRLPDGTETDARYALLRHNAQGEVIAADAVRATFLRQGSFSLAMPGDATGTIVDVIGDLTGTRRESALLIRPDRPWPTGTNLQDRQLGIRVTSALRDPCDEGYRIARVNSADGGLLRVDLQDYAPFVVSWHQVTELPPDRPNVIRTWRPMVDHANGPWYHGLKVWFPERGRTYTIRRVNEVGGGHGGDLAELVEDVNLADDGIRPGDWYVIYAVQPGLRVSVANDASWRQEPADGWQQFSLRATGTTTVTAPALAPGGSVITPGQPWRDLPAGAPLTVTATSDEATQVLIGRPAWLALADDAPPRVVDLSLDGQPVDPAKAHDLGWIAPPKQARVVLRDAENPLAEGSLEIALDGKALPAGIATTAFTPDRRAVTVTVDLAKATADEPHQPRRQTLTVAVSDQAVSRHTTRVSLSYLAQAPLDPKAVYISDLRRVRAFAHGGPTFDRDYVGDVAAIGSRVYPKGIMVCPEVSPEGAHGELVVELPEGGPHRLHTDVGIEESAKGNGSAVFIVQCGNSPEGPWETLATSPTQRGGNDAMTLRVDLGTARFLRLVTTDAGDGISSDHAFWGNARLLPAPPAVPGR